MVSIGGIYHAVLPEVVDNTYEGSQIVPITFGLLCVFLMIRSLIHIFKHDGGAQSIATIPLDKYPKPSADTIVLMFAYWGISQLLMAIVKLVILWKYRSLLPLACLIFTLEWVMRLIIPIVTRKGTLTEKEAPGAKGNKLFPLLGIVLFYASLP